MNALPAVKVRSGRTRHLRGAVVVGLGILVAANVMGVVRYPGGPLRQPFVDEPLWLELATRDAGTAVFVPVRAGLRTGEQVYTGVPLTNSSPWSLTIERVTLLAPTPGLRLEAVGLAKHGSEGSLAGIVTDAASAEVEDYESLPGALSPGEDASAGRLLLEVSATHPGQYRWDGVQIEYRLGPFTFGTRHHLGVDLCFGPMPSGTSCVDPIAEAS